MQRLSTVLNALYKYFATRGLGKAVTTPFPSRIMRSLWSSIVLLSVFLNTSQRSLAAHVELPRRSPTEPLPNVFARASDNSTSILDYFSGGYFINITLNGAPFSVMIDTGRCVD